MTLEIGWVKYTKKRDLVFQKASFFVQKMETKINTSVIL